jgi:four helix bundle protein
LFGNEGNVVILITDPLLPIYLPSEGDTFVTQKSIQLQTRTKAFALAIIRLVRTLPNRTESWVLGKQLLRSGTSVAANYRAACRARSRAEFPAKLGVVIEEADETSFWLDLLAEAGIDQSSEIQRLTSEANQFVAMFSAAQLTIKRNLEGKNTP